MEGTGELNEPVENSTDDSHLKRKESESPLQSNGENIMESAAAPAFVSQESEWHENSSSLRSPELVLENIKGKDLITHCTSLSTGPDSSYASDLPVEELTLKNFRPTNLALAGSSSSGSVAQGNSCLWQNFYKLIGEPRDVLTRGNIPSHPQSPPLQNILIRNDSSSSERAAEHGNRNIGTENSSPMRFVEGIRTKMLPSAGFPQFLVKNTLKGKGVAYRHPGAHRKPAAPQQAQKSDRDGADLAKGMNDAGLGSKLKPDKHPSLYGGGNLASSGAQEGISLRFWLRHGIQTINKAERLHIFKQILETVDISHANGLVMRHLRPSFFMMLSSKKVKYVGAFEAFDEQIELSEGSIGHGTRSHLKRKRYLDQGKGSLELLPRRNSRRQEVTQVGGRPDETETIDHIFDRERADSYSFNSGIRVPPVFGKGYLQQDASISVDALPVPEILQLEERWYACPEELVGAEACPFASNVYSLGVLFFELFCFFESWEVHAAAMLDLRHRILPSSFLSESPKEAGFCLWLLHPEPSSRPKSRDVLLSDLICESESIPIIDQYLASSYEEEDSEAELLLHFLLCVKEQKEKKAEKLVNDIGCLRSDIEEVDRRHSSRIQALTSNCRNPSSRYNEISDNILCKVPSHLDIAPKLCSSPMNEERLMKNIKQLETAYFSMRSRIELPDSNIVERSDKDVLQSRDRQPAMSSSDEHFSGRDTDRLGVFFEGLCKYARYSKFEVRGTLRNGDMLNSANVICSLSFDRDEEFFAAAGVSKKIKIFEYDSLLNDMVDIHYPAVEMSSRSKLSCVCWNGYIKNYLASTDYDGIVQLWDATTGQGFSQYVEHQKRAWSVDFSRVDPTKLASGSDDYCVKLWSINEKSSTSTIRNVANVCCVQFSADSTNLLAFGSADYKVYCYDLRNVRVPWCTLVGHGKAVSYVKFVDSATLISASTDNTLKLWDLNKTNPSGFSTSSCSLSLRGHTNEKNFVGLSVSDGYIACGSETNEVFTYYKSLPMPIASHKFGSIDPISGQEIGDDNGQFVSSVCWRGKSGMVVAANSAGGIKLLQMV